MSEEWKYRACGEGRRVSQCQHFPCLSTPLHPSGCPHHRARRATNVPKGIAAEEPLIHKMRLRKKNTANIVLHRESNKNQESEGREGGAAG